MSLAVESYAFPILAVLPNFATLVSVLSISNISSPAPLISVLYLVPLTASVSDRT